MLIRDALAAAAARLAPVSTTPRLDAELLMAHALGSSREQMLLGRLDEDAPETFEPLIARRLAHEPVAYISGRRAFWTIELEVGLGVLIPRPDSETLIEAAVERFGSAGPRSVLDLGTGPGSLLLAALDQWPCAVGLGVDSSEVALDFARRNAAWLGLADRARFRLGDWAEGLDERFDLILCNPPYVAPDAVLAPDVACWEPAEALYADEGGLGVFRRLAPALPALLADGGIACVEIGLGQAAEVGRLFESEGFAVAARADLAGVRRCLVLSLNN